MIKKERNAAVKDKERKEGISELVNYKARKKVMQNDKERNKWKKERNK